MGLRPRDDDVSHVILGRCGCVSHTSPLTELSSRQLLTPKWVESWERVKGCFPGGCEVCGVWMGCGRGEDDVQSVMKVLSEETDLKVCVCVCVCVKVL